MRKNTNQRQASNSIALHGFIAAKAQFDAMLARMQSLSDDHFGTDPDAINWGDVGQLDRYNELMRQITATAFREGEHAEECGASND